MPILQAMDGKYYDVPDAEAAAFEVPLDKVVALLEKTGMPAPQPPPKGGQGGQGGPPPKGGSAPGPVVVQIFAQPQGQHQGQPMAQTQGSPAYGAPAPGGGQEGDVDPYWFWRNVSGGGQWFNTWGNW